MEREAIKVENSSQPPILNLQAEALSAASLKDFYYKSKANIDLDRDGFVTGSELNKYKANYNPISREHRLAQALGDKSGQIQHLSRDEKGGWFNWSDSKGISSQDMAVFDTKARTTSGDRLVKSVNDDLASKNYEEVVRNAQELNEERIHLVDLAFRKHSFSLDPWDHIENALKTEHQTTLVGERQYNKYKIGETLSNQADYLGFLFNGDFNSYSVSVSGKRIETNYNWVDAHKQAHSLSAPIYKEIKAELARHGKTLIDTPYAGSTLTYISDKPISQMNIVSREPLNRYFVDVEISNSSLTFDFTKHLRNATTAHRVEMEVPENLYKKAKSVWDPHLSTNSFIIGGRVSSMHGEIKRKWTEIDPDFEQVKTDTGRTFVMPTKKR